MASTQVGFLLIADITGYTSYLSHSELEHAKDSLESLLDLLIEHTQLPLVVSRLEGDAVISYALPESLKQGQTLVDMVEETYVAFRKAIELMIINTTCTCNACKNLSSLDLKFFIHYGEFMLQPLTTYTELIGTDVNILHRLTKNSVTEKLGFKAYVMYSKAAVDSLGIQEMAAGMTLHTETYEHIGDVETYVLDMHPVWEKAKDEMHISVSTEDALLKFSADFPLAPGLFWGIVTKPEYMIHMWIADEVKVDKGDSSRVGPGSVYQCVHGTKITSMAVVDWQPVEQFSYWSTLPFGTTCLSTIKLDPIEEGTRMTLLMGKVEGGNALTRPLVNMMTPFVMSNNPQKGLSKLAEKVDEELNQRIIIQADTFTPPAGEVRKAVEESLAAVS